jgi:hypothetical protein
VIIPIIECANATIDTDFTQFQLLSLKMTNKAIIFKIKERAKNDLWM